MFIMCRRFISSKFLIIMRLFRAVELDLCSFNPLLVGYNLDKPQMEIVKYITAILCSNGI